MKTYDVMICGCGPSGAVLANLLRDYWHSVAIFDKDEDVFYAPRAMVFDDDSLRILQGAGVINQLYPDCIREVPGAHFTDKHRRHLLSVDFRSLEWRYGHAASAMFYQPGVEEILRKHFSQGEGVDSYLGYEVVHVEDTGQECKLIAKNADKGEELSFCSRYLVGCDGANSFVRQSMQVGRIDLGFSEPWFVMDTIVHDKSFFDSLPEESEFVCDVERPTIFVKGLQGHVRFDYVAAEGETFEDFKRDAVNQIAKYYEPEKFDIIRMAPYTFYAGMPDQWRKGRLLLAGDAAHQTPPFAGQGLNMGLRDAANLSFKLHLVLSGKASETILDSYQDERKPASIATIKGAVFSGQLMTSKNKMVNKLRNAMFFLGRHSKAVNNRLYKSILKKPHYSAGLIGSHALSGQIMIQPDVQNSEGIDVKLDSLLGRQFALLSVNELDSQELDEFCLKLDGNVLVLGKDIQDSTGKLKSWFAENQISCVLIRPDKYIYSASDSPRAICSDLIAQLASYSRA